MASSIDLGKMVEENSDYLLSFAMTKLDDVDLAKDLVQDTLFSAITKIETFENRSKLRTWLTSILNRKIIDHWRKAETRFTDPVSQFFHDEGNKKGHWIEQKGAQSSTILDEIEQSEQIAELHDCLGLLPDKWRGIVADKYLSENDSESICNEYEITTSNLWVIIHRAKLLLRDCLTTKIIQ